MRKLFLGLMFTGLIMLINACADTLADINKNPLHPDEKELQKDGILLGSFLPTLQKAVIPVSTGGVDAVNAYQLSVNLTADAWCGYLSPRDNKWHGGLTFPVYFFQENWSNTIFATKVKDVYVSWRGIKQHAMEGDVKNPNVYALAQIIKIAALNRATDTYGPIPYSQIGKGEFNVAYDAQEAVYQLLFDELEEAIRTLSAFTGDKLLPKFDVVYEGDVKKWLKYANSLMLRMSIRVRFADNAMAQKYAEMAVNHSAGVIETEAESAKMGQGAGLQMKNPLYTIDGPYDDTRMGAVISCYLNGYNDPRMRIYFKKANVAEEAWRGVRSGILGSGTRYDNFSRVNVVENDPVYWFRASETSFLRAEGALAGFEMHGTAEKFYNEGIIKSFDERGVPGAGNYINSTSKPAAYSDITNSSLNTGAPSDVTIRWENGATSEVKLEKIITQKYLAIFPDGQEAWTEWRRTGYPKQIPVKENKTNMGVKTGNGYSDGVRRMPYPRIEYDKNIENVRKAIVENFGGEDLASKKLWWDKKN